MLAKKTKSIILLNAAFSVCLQFITMLNGFVIPRIILSNFGSEVNGLITSLNQFLNYISLLEGGISGVVMSELYKPLAEQDDRTVGGIFSTVNNFFTKIGKIYILYMLALAVIYPLTVNNSFSYNYVFLLTLILGINQLVRYLFSLSYLLLLNADRKIYITSSVQIVALLVNLSVTIILVYLYPNIHIIKLGSAIAFLIQPVCYQYFAKRSYRLEAHSLPNDKFLAQRWDGAGQNLAYFVHTNTDVVILTICASLKDISVYSVYFMVANALKGLVYAVTSVVNPSFGNALVTKSKEHIHIIFDKWEFGISFLTTFLFTNAVVLIIPFVSLYTKGIQDTNYNQPVFASVILLAEAVYCFRDPYISSVYAAGQFRKTAKYAYMEAAINIILSIILVFPFGITGIAVGTLVSMIYRLIAHVLYLKRNILKRKTRKFIKSICIFWISGYALASSYMYFFNIKVNMWIDWFRLAIKSSVYCLAGLCIVVVIFYMRDIKKWFLVER